MKKFIPKFLDQYKFCFKCGGQLEFQEKNLLICKSCGYHNYINPIAANGAVLENEQGEILLVVRKVDPQKGMLDVPGGFVDLDENVEESMKRELIEELGFSPKNLKYYTSYPDEYFYDGVLFPTLILLFVGRVKDEKIIPHDDISGYKFYKKEEIPFDNIAFEGLKKTLKKYINDRK